eukprot:CAMPEP_0172363084 /NCGR_PEP_ID=MMETSP1060-20121228/6533_1 /TAXON_ID=37318 /ORGANISM="Pseudo-nitzschia pungens, Strain cf. cingulata" /LENGTH=572 /DNA_ID=CAMNT_0013085747 /DNA_START=381 /DNA_END=2099 /DNA_ORIENTATION=+
MFHQPFFHVSHRQHKQSLTTSHKNATVSCDTSASLKMPAVASKLTVAADHSSNAWTKSDWYLGFRNRNFHHSYQQHQHQHQHQHQQHHQQHHHQIHAFSTSPRVPSGTSFMGMINKHNNATLISKCSSEVLGDDTNHRPLNRNRNRNRNRERSDSDTATTNTMTSPSTSLIPDSSFWEDDIEEDTGEFFLEGMDETIHIHDDKDHKDDKEGIESESKDRDCVVEPIKDDGDEYWSDSTEVRNNISSVLIQEASEETEMTTTTTKTKTTTTTTTRHTRSATIDSKHKNQTIFVYPQYVPGNPGIAIQSSQNSGINGYGTVMDPSSMGDSNHMVIPFDGPQVTNGMVPKPDTNNATKDLQHLQQHCCPCCASKKREIERQRKELKHMDVLVKKLCGLLADTVRSQKGINGDEQNRLASRNEEAILHHSDKKTTPSARSNCTSDKDSDTATTTSNSIVTSNTATSSSSLSSGSPLPCRQRKICSRPIRRVSASCPRSKNHRIEVNGEVGTYSGPAMSREGSEHYQRSGIIQGCVVRFDNEELYVGSLSRNDTGSLTFHPPGTLYDSNRVPKRRVR